MKILKFLFSFSALLLLFNLSSFAQRHEYDISSKKEIIKVSTDTLFSVIDYFNYFTDRKFEEMFNSIKQAWTQRNFEKFDRLVDSLGRDVMLVALLREKAKNRKDKYILRLPPDTKRIRFLPESAIRSTTPKSTGGEIEPKPPEKQDVVASCECPSPCIVCFCPGSCDVPYVLCLCFYDSSPGGIPGGGGGGYFCNMFRGGKPCAVRPPDFVPR